MKIDPAGPIPIYFQLKTLLKEAIQEGRFGPDDRIPTEDELCAQHGISRTPVHRALSELAEEGVLVRYRRRGTFVHPHWLERSDGGPELRVVVLDERWEPLVRAAAPRGARLNFARFPQPDLHQAITHAVAEARAPDLSMIDSVWVAEFAASGFLRPLDEV
ncbi:MAG: GntR family transcriptional regulator, partial [Acidimicrobiia bacterium]